MGSDRNDSSLNFPLGLPIIYSEEGLLKLNEYLKKNNVLILFKLHPHQDTTLFKASSLSNIKIYLLANSIDYSSYLYKNQNLLEKYLHP